MEVDPSLQEVHGDKSCDVCLVTCFLGYIQACQFVNNHFSQKSSIFTVALWKLTCKPAVLTSHVFPVVAIILGSP